MSDVTVATESGLMTIRFSQGGALNASTVAMLETATDAIGSAANDPRVRAVLSHWGGQSLQLGR